MMRRVLLLLAVAGIYAIAKRRVRAPPPRENVRAAEAQWANEGGANAPAGV